MCRVTEYSLILCVIHGHPVFSNPYIEDAVFSQCTFFLPLFQISVIRCTHVSVFCFILLMYMSILVSIPYWFYYYSFIIDPKVQNGTPLVFFSLFRIALALQGISCFHMNFRFLCEVYWGFNWGCIESINFLVGWSVSQF